MQVKKQVRTRHRTTNWFKTEKLVGKCCILFPCLFNLYAEYIIEMAGWTKDKLESRLQEELPTTSDMLIIPV